MTFSVMEQTFEFEQNWDNDGMMTWKNARTLNRYRELSNQHPDDSKYGVFFAFGDSQFAEGVRKLIARGYIREGEEGNIASYGGGLYGLPSELERFFGFYEERKKLIAAECDPQEVYCYEFNNFECCIAYDGDLNAIRHIADIWGVDVARTIMRKSVLHSTEALFGNTVE